MENLGESHTWDLWWLELSSAGWCLGLEGEGETVTQGNGTVQNEGVHRTDNYAPSQRTQLKCRVPECQMKVSDAGCKVSHPGPRREQMYVSQEQKGSGSRENV